MTLNDITVAALEQLGRGHDPQTLDNWRGSFTSYANDAQRDIARAMGLRRSEEAEVKDGEIALEELERGCEKVMSVIQDGVEAEITTGPNSARIKVSCADGPVTVSYRYTPKSMSAATDKPEIPEYAHELITLYVVARERAAQDPSMQRGSQVYFEMYHAGLKRLRQYRGEADSYRIINRW